jgi:hypothetical protein
VSFSLVPDYCKAPFRFIVDVHMHSKLHLAHSVRCPNIKGAVSSQISLELPPMSIKVSCLCYLLTRSHLYTMESVLMNADLISLIMEHMSCEEVLLSQRVSREFKRTANFPEIRRITCMSPVSRESNVNLAHNNFTPSPCPLLSDYSGPKLHHPFKKPKLLNKPGSWQQMFLTWPPVTRCTACLTYQSDQRPAVMIIIKRAEVHDMQGLTIGSLLSRARRVEAPINVRRDRDGRFEEVTTTVDELMEQLAKERRSEPIETFSLVVSPEFCPSVCWMVQTD